MTHNSRRIRNFFTGTNDERKDNRPPFVFSRTSIWFWISAFVILILIVHRYGSDFDIKDEDSALAFLHVNIEVLVTMLTVTMGITLLGIQFRVQSYTMLALIKYVKDPIIYGFIATFVALIIFSMLATTTTLVFGPILAAQYAFVGTMFALAYLAGYIYYMIYKIQPSQVLRHTYQDMEKQIMKYIENTDEKKKKSDSRELEGFEVWEQIMIRAIEADNISIFKQGIKMIFELWEKHIINDKNMNPNSAKIFSELINTVALSCVKEERGRFVEEFMERFIGALTVLLHKHPDDLINVMFDTWERLMTSAVDGNNGIIFEKGIKTMLDLLEDTGTDKEKRMKIMGFFPVRINIIMPYCMTKNRELLITIFMDRCKKVSKHSNDEINPEYRKMMFDAWMSVMLKAVETGNEHVFKYGIEVIFHKWHDEMKAGTSKDYDSRFFPEYINEVMLYCIEYNRERFVSTFMNIFMDTMMKFWKDPKNHEYEREMFETWENAMIRSVEFDSMHIFDRGIRIAGKLHDEYLNIDSKKIDDDGLGMIFNTYRLIETCLKHDKENFIINYLLILGDALIKYDDGKEKNIAGMSAIWWNIMSWAVKKDNKDVFDNIMYKIDHLRDKCIENLGGKVDSNMRMFAQIIILVIGNSVTYKRPSFIADHMDSFNIVWLHLIKNSKQSKTNEKMFMAWEQVMIWAIENNKFDVFRNGMETIFDVHEHIRNCPKEARDDIIKSFSIHYNTVISALAGTNDDNFSRIFTESFGEALNSQSDSGIADTNEMFKLWNRMAEKTVQYGNIHVVDEIVKVIDMLERADHDHAKKLQPLFCSSIIAAVRLIMSNNHNTEFRAYFQYMNKHQRDDDNDMNNIIDTWEQIMHRAIRDDKVDIFALGMSGIFELCRRVDSKQVKMTNLYHSAVMRVMKDITDERYMRKFLSCFTETSSKNGLGIHLPTSVLRHIIIRSAHMYNIAIFDDAVKLLDELMTVEDKEFFKSFSKEIREHSQRNDKIKNIDNLIQCLDEIIKLTD